MKKVLIISILLIFVMGCSNQVVQNDEKNVSLENEPKQTVSEPEPEPTLDDLVKAYMEKGNISLTAKDVQYDMKNNLGKDFVIVGTAELRDYYNYGFDDSIEDRYFNILLTPENGSYLESWHLYINREKNKDLFNALKEGEVFIIANGIIPENRYKKGQGNMALAANIIWIKR